MANPDLINRLFALLVAVLASWQVKVIAGLILLDLVLGVASALKRGVFDWGKLAEFYKTGVLPYVLGYVVLYVVVGFIIPPESLGQLGDPINEAAVTLAWATLTINLLKSITANFQELYAAPQ